MQALLCTIGSLGDVRPMLVLARALEQRGHAVQLAAPPNFRDLAESEGVSFVGLGADTERILEENRQLAERSPLLALPAQLALLRRELARQQRDLFAASIRADLVVGAGLAFGARTLADKLGARYAYVCYTLAGIRSQKHAPAAIPLLGLPAWGNRTLWWLITHGFDWAMRAPLDATRRAQGLPADPSPWRSIHASETLLAQDPILGSLPADAVGCQTQVPALVDSSAERALPAEVAQFLEPTRSGQPTRRRERYVYLGFGSMPTVDRERITRAAVDLSRVTGARVLLGLGGAEPPRSLPAEVLAIGSVDHRVLFPALDLIVHHGGAGTTATALRAGVPQLIVPHIVDQFFHGQRIAELGLGTAPVPKAKLDAKKLGLALESAPRQREKAQSVARTLGGTSGAEAAANYLEEVTRRTPLAASR